MRWHPRTLIRKVADTLVTHHLSELRDFTTKLMTEAMSKSDTAKVRRYSALLDEIEAAEARATVAKNAPQQTPHAAETPKPRGR